MNIPEFSMFEKAVAQTRRIEAIKTYRYRTGLGLKEAKYALDSACQSGLDVPSISETEGLLLRTVWQNLDNKRQEVYKQVESLYMNRTSGVPQMFLIGDESGMRDGINPNYYFTSADQVEKYVREELYDYVAGIHNFRLEDGKFKFNDEDNLEWILTIHPLKEYQCSTSK